MRPAWQPRQRPIIAALLPHFAPIDLHTLAKKADHRLLFYPESAVMVCCLPAEKEAIVASARRRAFRRCRDLRQLYVHSRFKRIANFRVVVDLQRPPSIM